MMLWHERQAPCNCTGSHSGPMTGGAGAASVPCWGRSAWERQKGKSSIGVRSKICLLATRKGMSLSCSVPQTTCPLWSNLPAVPAWRPGEPVVWADRGRLQCRRQGSQWRGREQSPFLPLTLMASCYRCIPVTSISETHAIPPSGLTALEFRNSIYVHLAVHLPDPLLSLEQFDSSLHFQLHHLLLPAANEPAM